MRHILVILIFTAGFIGGAVALVQSPVPDTPMPGREQDAGIDLATVRKAAQLIAEVIDVLNGDPA